MKTKLYALLLVTGLSAVSSAATVAIARSGAGTGIQTQTSSGIDLTGGNYFIGVGTYLVAPTITDQASFLSAVNSFALFGSALSPVPTATTAGLIIGSITATDTAFNSSPLYMLIGNGSTKANSTEFAIIQGTSPAWTFAANVALAGSTTYTLANASQFAVVGVAGTEIDNATGFDGLQLRAIPEPSTIFFGIFGVMGFLRRRRN